MARDAGLPIVDRDWISNSRIALEASEYAREAGMFDAFHRHVFHAYFAEGRDIGRLNEIKAIGAEAGLDPDELEQAITSGRYAERVNEDLTLAARIGLTGVPAFILGNRAIIGAQPYEAFEHVMTLVGARKKNADVDENDAPSIHE
jgi:predicted DsbA family dithiol-disulfide isomerase